MSLIYDRARGVAVWAGGMVMVIPRAEFMSKGLRLDIAGLIALLLVLLYSTFLSIPQDLVFLAPWEKSYGCGTWERSGAANTLPTGNYYPHAIVLIRVHVAGVPYHASSSYIKHSLLGCCQHWNPGRRNTDPTTM